MESLLKPRCLFHHGEAWLLTRCPPDSFWRSVVAAQVVLWSAVLFWGCNNHSKEKPNNTDSSTAVQSVTPSALETKSNSTDNTSSVSFDHKVQQAVKFLEEQKIDEAWKLSRELMIAQPENNRTICITARVMAARKDYKSAIAMMSRISEDHPDAGVAVLGHLAEWLIEQGDLQQAEAKLLKLLKRNNRAADAIRMLVRIYNAQGRRWETARLLDRLVRIGNFTFKDLSMSVDFRESYIEDTYHAAAIRFAPDDPINRFSYVRQEIIKYRFQEQMDDIEAICKAKPELLEAWLFYANCLLGLERFEELSRWLETPPRSPEKHPEYWYIRGSLLMRGNAWPEATRCFAESIKLDRRHIASYQELANCLLEMGQVEDAAQVREACGHLRRISDIVQQLLRGFGDPSGYSEVSRLYGKLGDVVGEFAWEAIAHVERNEPISEKLKASQSKLQEGFNMPPTVLASLHVDAWPMPVSISKPIVDKNPPVETDSNVVIRLEDVAESKGIRSQYLNGARLDQGWYTIEGLGGGVSVIDFDRDGWPDLYFGQAGDSPLNKTPRYLPKQLYRNVQAQQFLDITFNACVADIGFGQGTGVADIDQDGFHDLLIANLGGIVYLRNQGDGTFESVELPQSPSESAWNSSIQAADLNGDHLPDLIQGCYIYGLDGVTRRCPKAGSVRSSCNPRTFPPGRNRILYSDAQGGWAEADADLLESIRQGYTLGTLTTNIDGREGNDVFFANDVSANHFLLSKSDPTTGARSLVECAAACGVAVDSMGRPQACMGIACGDQNRDGMLDLIVTNFRDEVNTLYLQMTPGVFADGTLRARLGGPSKPYVGFGCQLTDLENDGWLDLVVVNGHIDDLRDENIPWHMPSQVLHNDKGVFTWLKSPSPGKYFDGEWIGRGLSALDFNRDGKMDFIATHMDRNAALLENRSVSRGHFLQLELIGTQCERDAIGANIQIKAGGESWVTAVNSGEGYYGSNQALVHMGIGSHSRIDELTIRWPSGDQSQFSSLEADRRYMVVQGQDISSVQFP